MPDRINWIDSTILRTQNNAINSSYRNRAALVICALVLMLPLLTSSRITRSTEDAAQKVGLQGSGFINSDKQIDNCITPEQRIEINQKITEYEARIGSANLGPQAEPQPYSFFPQAGLLWQDLFVNNFVDLDPTSAIKDWDCTDYTYDGHRGHDSDIRSFQVQAIGVPVFAALDGTVVEAHDGEFDMNTQAGQFNANYVILDHGNGHRSIYFHLKRGSVSVTPSQFVKAGTQIGLTGSSGSSTWPHLHFESQINGTVFEPSAGACRPGVNNWVHQIPIRRELYVRDFSFSNVDFNSDRGLPFDNAPRIGTFVSGLRTVYFKVQMAGLPANSTRRVRFIRPDGSIAIDNQGSFGNDRFFRWAWYWYVFNVNLNLTGTWHLLIDINNQSLIDAPFDVVASESQISNRPPNPITCVFEPSSPESDDVIFCRVQTSLVSADPDYDIVRYHYIWSVNGTVVRNVTTAALSDAIPKDLTRPGDNVICTVTPSDALAFGPAVTSTVIIRAPELPKPNINSAAFDGKKTLTIIGNRFGTAPHILVNDTDRTDRVIDASDTLIKLKAKAKKLGLKPGDNTIQILDSNGQSSNVVVVRL